MAQFYVPIQVNPAAVIDGLSERIPHMHPYFDKQEKAAAYLRDELNKHGPEKDVYFTRDNAPESLQYGPDGTELKAPQVTEIHRVEITDTNRLDLLKLREQPYPLIGKAGYARLTPGDTLDVTATIHRDVLHDAYTVESRDISQARREVQEHMAIRMTALQRFAGMIERSTPEELMELDMRNPNVSRMIKDAYAVNGFCHKENHDMSLADRTLQIVREIAAHTGARTVLSVMAIQAEFNSRLESLPPTTPEAERVAVAMEGTLAKFAASVPARDAAAVRSVQETVRGTVHELEAEMDSKDITKHELGDDEQHGIHDDNYRDESDIDEPEIE